MQVCGSRAKMRRLYERQRQTRSTTRAGGSSSRASSAANATTKSAPISSRTKRAGTARP
jgi:hypothetical protein